METECVDTSAGTRIVTEVEDRGKKLPKIFILDTNILMHDPNAFTAFGNNTVIIPSIVLEELDNHKKDPKNGYSVREVIRKMEDLVEGGDVIKGVRTPGGGILKVDTDGDDLNLLPVGFDRNKPDNIILLTTQRIKRLFPKQEVVLVSNDIILRLKGQSQGSEAQKYLSGRVVERVSTKSSVIELFVPDEVITQIHGNELKLDEALFKDVDTSKLPAYACLRLIGNVNRKSCLAILNSYSKTLKCVKSPTLETREGKRGIHPRNEEQAFALALAMSKATLVTLSGPAGTGKSLMALIAGWNLVVGKTKSFVNQVMPDCQRNTIQQMIIYRPTCEIGTPLGFLPGSLGEKILPWQRATKSNLDLIASAEGQNKEYVQNFLDKQKIEILPINYLRGDTVNNTLMILDDAQNFTPRDIKAAITRVGEGSRLIITGDATQVDDPHLDEYSNGFSHVLAKFPGQEIYATLHLVKSERSVLAGIAATIL
jgi:PhoH-like ATPase